MDDNELRASERVLEHLNAIEKAYKVDKMKIARERLLQEALEGKTEALKVGLDKVIGPCIRMLCF